MTRTTDFGDVIRRKLAKNPALAEMVEEAAVNAQIAREIYRARKAAGLTQAQLARLADTTQSVIARIEDADYDGHSLSLIKKIARALRKRLRVEFYDEPQPRQVIDATLQMRTETHALYATEVTFNVKPMASANAG